MKHTLIVVGLIASILGHAQVIDTLAVSPFDLGISHPDDNGYEAHSLKEWFAKGDTHGFIRYHFMSTINENELSDYWANAVGGRLYYRTAKFHGFEVGAAVNVIFNIGSSDLTQLDPQVGKGSRWEKQLFDLADLENKHDLDLLEELYVKYQYRGSFIEFGRLTINTPLANEQDSRMKPTAFHGIWSELVLSEKFKINTGWFNKVSPRSTTRWYRIEDAIGIYGRGVNLDGTTSGYGGNLTSNGMGVVGLSYSSSHGIKAQWWEYYLDNLLNANFLQVDYTTENYEFGLQYLREDQIQSGGNEDPGRTYFPYDHTANLFSGKAGLKQDKWTASINYTQALNTGRFTFPREFGTAKLYTFISRHRVEGLGDFKTVALKFNYYPLDNQNLDLGVSFARTATQGADNFQLNKYGFLTYNQMNIDLKYKFKKHLEGLDIRLLYLLDKSNSLNTENPTYVFNKTNLSHFNLKVDYNF